MDSKRSKDVVIPIDEARGLRDEISKVLTDFYSLNSEKPSQEPIKIEIKGNGFK